MMIKNCTNFALIAGIGLSLFSESSQTALTTMGHEDSHMTVSARSPARLGPITVLHHYDDGFSVLNKGTKHVVENHLVGRELRTIAELHSLEAFLENGYISVNQGNDNKYSLQARGRLMGGGGDDSLITSGLKFIGSIYQNPLGKAAIVGGAGVLGAAGTKKAIKYLHTDTPAEKNIKNFHKDKLELYECLRKHTSAGSTTEIPPECEEPVRQFQQVASAEQLADSLRCLKRFRNDSADTQNIHISFDYKH